MLNSYYCPYCLPPLSGEQAGNNFKETILDKLGAIKCYKERKITARPNEWQIIPIQGNSEFP